MSSDRIRTDLVEVADDLVEEAEALQALLVDVVLVVELFVVRDGGEHHGHVLVPLGVELLERELEGKVRSFH